MDAKINGVSIMKRWIFAWFESTLQKIVINYKEEHSNFIEE